MRLPDRLWKLMERAAAEEGTYVNGLLWRLTEGYLIKRGDLDKKDRKRLPLN